MIGCPVTCASLTATHGSISCPHQESWCTRSKRIAAPRMPRPADKPLTLRNTETRCVFSETCRPGLHAVPPTLIPPKTESSRHFVDQNGDARYDGQGLGNLKLPVPWAGITAPLRP